MIKCHSVRHWRNKSFHSWQSTLSRLVFYWDCSVTCTVSNGARDTGTSFLFVPLGEWLGALAYRLTGTAASELTNLTSALASIQLQKTHTPEWTYPVISKPKSTIMYESTFKSAKKRTELHDGMISPQSSPNQATNRKTTESQDGARDVTTGSGSKRAASIKAPNLFILSSADC